MKIFSALLVLVVLFGGGWLAASLLGDEREGEAAEVRTRTAAAFDPRFVGHWELVSYVSFRASGETVTNDYLGRIIYDELGNMTAVGMPRDLPERARANPDEVTRGGFAYFSDATVYPQENRIVHSVLASPTHPSWPGGDQIRFFEFDGELLKLSLREGDQPNGRITGTLTWRRMR